MHVLGEAMTMAKPNTTSYIHTWNFMILSPMACYNSGATKGKATGYDTKLGEAITKQNIQRMQSSDDLGRRIQVGSPIISNSRHVLKFFIFLLSFVSGNLFPTFFSTFTGSFTSFFLILLIESFNLLRFAPFKPHIRIRSCTQPLATKQWRSSKPKIWTGNSEPLARSGSLQLCGAQTRISELGLCKFPYSEIRRAKIGFLFGLFVDAFKVGS
jgi:hypothetical protein